MNENILKFIKDQKCKTISQKSVFSEYEDEIKFLLSNKISKKQILFFLKAEYNIKSSYTNFSQWCNRHLLEFQNNLKNNSKEVAISATIDTNNKAKENINNRQEIAHLDTLKLLKEINEGR